MTGLACPFNVQSSPIYRDGALLYEVIDPLCFRDAVASGLTPSGRPIPLVRGHDRNGRTRRDWVIADTSNGLHLRVTKQGVILEAPGDLPADFTGFSVRLRPYKWVRIGPAVFRLLRAGIVHIALLQGEKPCYPQTRSLALPVFQCARNRGGTVETG